MTGLLREGETTRIKVCFNTRPSYRCSSLRISARMPGDRQACRMIARHAGSMPVAAKWLRTLDRILRATTMYCLQPPQETTCFYCPNCMVLLPAFLGSPVQVQTSTPQSSIPQRDLFSPQLVHGLFGSPSTPTATNYATSSLSSYLITPTSLQTCPHTCDTKKVLESAVLRPGKC
ncbi:unnamed protein product [Somion occarium]|uniref:Uncharacterized protein n=1 Tax=Somion occarium TaxID=3059160 RepID=A0ABP1D3R6_9APHY